MNKNLVSPIREASPGKASMNLSDGSGGGALLTPAPENHRENFPPSNVNSLEDQFKNNSIGPPGRHSMPGPYSP
jgi:hypothetical protein